MANLIVALLLLAYISIDSVRAGDTAAAVPAWWNGPAIPGVTKYCMKDKVERLPSGEEDNIYKNMGGCTCTEAKQHMQKLKELAESRKGPEAGFSVQCDESGNWKRKQQVGKGGHCVDTDGNQITKWTADNAGTPLVC